MRALNNFIWFPVTSTAAHHELPRPRHNKNHVRTFNLNPTLIPSKDPYDDNNHFRKHGKIYIIPLDSYSKVKKLPSSTSGNEDSTSLVLQNVKVSSYDPELPLKKSLPMLPLVTFDETHFKDDDSEVKLAKEKSYLEAPSDEEIIYLTEQKKNENRLTDNLVRLLRQNGIYEAKPEMGTEKKMRSLNWRSSKPQELNDEFSYERKNRGTSPKVYKFSDLVL